MEMTYRLENEPDFVLPLPLPQVPGPISARLMPRGFSRTRPPGIVSARVPLESGFFEVANCLSWQSGGPRLLCARSLGIRTHSGAWRGFGFAGLEAYRRRL